ncbi:MAG: hypothetical protein K2G32_01515, partial [Oscillospiraceae bacterium]|nr:hypothetical protein [Oscillospiraceae bacterium]
MKKVYALSVILAALLLAGCDGNTPPESSNIEDEPFVQTRAIRTAHSVALERLEDRPCSLNQLVGYLEKEGFSHDEAVDAAENCGADWNEQALNKALSILENYACGYDHIVRELEEYNLFTHEQAVYAADNCGADWFELALKCAQTEINESAYSYSDLIEELEARWNGFTHEQAVYAADNVNVDWAAQPARCA